MTSCDNYGVSDRVLYCNFSLSDDNFVINRNMTNSFSSCFNLYPGFQDANLWIMFYSLYMYLAWIFTSSSFCNPYILVTQQQLQPIHTFGWILFRKSITKFKCAAVPLYPSAVQPGEDSDFSSLLKYSIFSSLQFIIILKCASSFNL